MWGRHKHSRMLGRIHTEIWDYRSVHIIASFSLSSVTTITFSADLCSVTTDLLSRYSIWGTSCSTVLHMRVRIHLLGSDSSMFLQPNSSHCSCVPWHSRLLLSSIIVSITSSMHILLYLFHRIMQPKESWIIQVPSMYFPSQSLARTHCVTVCICQAV